MGHDCQLVCCEGQAKNKQLNSLHFQFTFIQSTPTRGVPAPWKGNRLAALRDVLPQLAHRSNIKDGVIDGGGARRDSKSSSATLKSSNSLLQHIVRGVHESEGSTEEGNVNF